MLSFNANIYYADYWGKTLILILIGKQLQSLLRTACKFYFPQNDRVQFHKPRNAGERLTYKLDIKGTKAQNPLRTFSHHSKRLLQCTYKHSTLESLPLSQSRTTTIDFTFQTPLINYDTQKFKLTGKSESKDCPCCARSRSAKVLSLSSESDKAEISGSNPLIMLTVAAYCCFVASPVSAPLKMPPNKPPRDATEPDRRRLLRRVPETEGGWSWRSPRRKAE